MSVSECMSITYTRCLNWLCCVGWCRSVMEAEGERDWAGELPTPELYATCPLPTSAPPVLGTST